MKNNHGVSLVEIIISVALLSLVMLFLFRLLLIVRNEDNLNVNKLNVNTLISLVISEIHDDFNSKGLKYIYKPTCIDPTNIKTNCCCSLGSYDCLKFYYKTGEVKELSIFETNSFNDSIRYGAIKRILPENYSFLSSNTYNMATTTKFEFDEMGVHPTTGTCLFYTTNLISGEIISGGAPASTGYDANSFIDVSIPIYRLTVESDKIEIRDVFDCFYIQNELSSTDGSLVRDTCPVP